MPGYQSVKTSKGSALKRELPLLLVSMCVNRRRLLILMPHLFAEFPVFMFSDLLAALFYNTSHLDITSTQI
jgi:hypothetical protein